MSCLIAYVSGSGPWDSELSGLAEMSQTTHQNWPLIAGLCRSCASIFTPALKSTAVNAGTCCATSPTDAIFVSIRKPTS